MSLSPVCMSTLVSIPATVPLCVPPVLSVSVPVAIPVAVPAPVSVGWGGFATRTISRAVASVAALLVARPVAFPGR